jgi:hypothetical protein
MGFFPPSRGRGRSWIDRMKGLEQEEEDLEEAVSHLSRPPLPGASPATETTD